MISDADVVDITSFADPFTAPKVKNVGTRKSVEIIRNARKLIYEIEPSGRVAAKHRNRTYPSIESLIASDELANLQGFSATQVRKASSTASKIPPIPVKIQFKGQNLPIDELSSLLTPVDNKVHLILLDGPAGIGKTFQLEQLAFGEAKKCAAGRPATPVLHVTSRGRRLSNLGDVFAASTQDLGASFGASHVPILVRRRLLIVAIDGFDELVDADGYEYSWSALRSFLVDLDRSGIVVLAARDTFVEEQELLGRIQQSEQVVELSMGHIQPISPDDATAWLKLAPHWKLADFTSDIASDVLAPGSYALRPFFLRTLRDSKGWVDVVEEGPRTYLVNRLLQREAKLVATQLARRDVAEIHSALVALMQEISQEMCERETDTIEQEHLAYWTEYCFGEILDADSLRKLVHKSGSFAILENGYTSRSRRFPHSEIQHFFLGGGLIRALASNIIPVFLRRTTISAEQLDVFSEILEPEVESSRSAVNTLVSALNQDKSLDSLITNGGALALLAFALGLLDRVDYLTALDASFAGGVPVGKVNECAIGRLDICGSDISSVVFSRTTVATLVINDLSVVGGSLPTIEALEYRQEVPAEIFRNSQEIEAKLREITRETNNFDLEYASVRLLERIARRAVKHFYLREHGDEDEGGWLLKDKDWTTVRDALEKFDRIEFVKGKQMHGRRSMLIRIKSPLKLLDRNNIDTNVIINYLKSLG